MLFIYLFSRKEAWENEKVQITLIHRSEGKWLEGKTEVSSGPIFYTPIIYNYHFEEIPTIQLHRKDGTLLDEYTGCLTEPSIKFQKVNKRLYIRHRFLQNSDVFLYTEKNLDCEISITGHSPNHEAMFVDVLLEKSDGGFHSIHTTETIPKNVKKLSFSPFTIAMVPTFMLDKKSMKICWYENDKMISSLTKKYSEFKEEDAQMQLQQSQKTTSINGLQVRNLGGMSNVSNANVSKSESLNNNSLSFMSLENPKIKLGKLNITFKERDEVIKEENVTLNFFQHISEKKKKTSQMFTVYVAIDMTLDNAEPTQYQNLHTKSDEYLEILKAFWKILSPHYTSSWYMTTFGERPTGVHSLTNLHQPIKFHFVHNLEEYYQKVRNNRLGTMSGTPPQPEKTFLYSEADQFGRNEMFPVIDELLRNYMNDSTYNILIFLISNDHINVKETVGRLIKIANEKPLSILICGVGDSSFKTWRSINPYAHIRIFRYPQYFYEPIIPYTQNLRLQYQKARRDVFKFLMKNSYDINNSKGQSNAASVMKKDVNDMCKDLLSVIPNHFMAYHANQLDHINVMESVKRIGLMFSQLKDNIQLEPNDIGIETATATSPKTPKTPISLSGPNSFAQLKSSLNSNNSAGSSPLSSGNALKIMQSSTNKE